MKLWYSASLVEFPKQDLCPFLELLKWGEAIRQGKELSGQWSEEKSEHGNNRHLKEISLITQNNRIPKFKNFINCYYCWSDLQLCFLTCLHVFLIWNWVNKPPTIHYTILLFCKKAIQFWESAGEAWKQNTLGRETDFTGEQKRNRSQLLDVPYVLEKPFSLFGTLEDRITYEITHHQIGKLHPQKN